MFKRRKVRKIVKEALSDGLLTDDEARTIKTKQDELGVSDDYVDQLRSKHFEASVAPIIRRVESTRRLTPDDEAELNDIATKLRVNAKLDSGLERYRLLWQLEFDPQFLPVPLNVALNLGRGEECYGSVHATWCQMKTFRKRHVYSGGSVGFRVAKGVTLRFGQYKPITTTEEKLYPKSDGLLYVTNKKLLFVCDRSSTNITFGRLANVELFSDGIEIFKTSGKPDVFLMTNSDLELISLLIQRFI